MFKPHHILQAALVTLVASGCGGRYRTEEGLPPAGAEGYATVRVENENIRDMRIYVRPGATGTRFRLGTASGMETTTLKIPRAFVTGVTELVFEISPISGGGSEFSQRISVSPGDEIVLRIPSRY
ncbi:MAG TPA: hypothetical protein VGQ73_09615 [Gemmatimonadales bacterium]|jgi:hypothetical protein|nr:hypothetical protein [Gemmatimonadales bacterium]